MRKSKKHRNDPNSLNLILFEPKSDWSPPDNFPDLSGERIIGFDIETRDPELTKRGSGFFRGSAETVGISLATTDQAWYFPIGHLGGGNVARGPVLRYLQDLFSRSDLTLVGAHSGYDLEGLDHLGLSVSSRVLDVQIAEALIDEEQDSYALESLSKKYLGIGKDERILSDAASAFGIDPKSELWKLHSRFVGPYAEADASNTIRIFQRQLPILTENGLLAIFELESKLLPIIYGMRKLGIRMDLEGARILSRRLEDTERSLRAELRSRYQLDDEWSAQKIAAACDRKGISYGYTLKGNPSFDSKFLEHEGAHDIFKRISELREYNRLRAVFIDKWIFNNIDEHGIIHPSWHQTARDEGGTRTGRMAASNPNPQQIPSRSGLAADIRALFIPTPGHQWCKVDYSQQEPRLTVHYAVVCKLSSAGLVQKAYNQNKGMDIYQFLADACGMSRRDSKDATLGRIYGMGAETFARRQGLTTEQAKTKLEEFDKSVPFVKELVEFVTNKANERGWIKTLCGRKRHFNFWEPVNSWELGKRGIDVTPVRIEYARDKWPKQALRRAYTHKALNSLIQGSAADMTKSAMLAVYEKLGLVPHMQVHDELNYSVESEEQAREIQRVCETCVDIEVPIKADLDLGEHWK